MKLLATLVLLLNVFAGFCQQKPDSLKSGRTYKSEFGFKSDNDAYLAYGQDRYYTNGLFITFRHALPQEKLLKKTNKLIYEIEIGQKMYNPRSGNQKVLERIDRPFAAYLYGGLSFNWLYKSENSLKVNIQGGTIGPNAQGKDAQVLLHKTFGFYPINGWDWQVKNAAGVNTNISYQHFLHRNELKTLDFSIQSYLNAGNTFSGAGAGILFRTGTLNQFFNSVYANSVISNHSQTTPLSSREVFFYLKPMVNYVAFDATIEGGASNEDKGPVTFKPKPFVFSQELGIMYSKNRLSANFALTFKSREIESRAKAHQYGSVSLNYRFN